MRSPYIVNPHVCYSCGVWESVTSWVRIERLGGRDIDLPTCNGCRSAMSSKELSRRVRSKFRTMLEYGDV